MYPAPGRKKNDRVAYQNARSIKSTIPFSPTNQCSYTTDLSTSKHQYQTIAHSPVRDTRSQHTLSGWNGHDVSNIFARVHNGGCFLPSTRALSTCDLKIPEEFLCTMTEARTWIILSGPFLVCAYSSLQPIAHVQSSALWKRPRSPPQDVLHWMMKIIH